MSSLFHRDNRSAAPFLAFLLAVSLTSWLVGCGAGNTTSSAELHASHLKQINARHLKAQAESTPALQKHAKLPRKDGLKGSASSMHANGRVVDVFDEWLVASAGTPAQVETRVTYVVYSFLTDAVLTSGQVDPQGSVHTEVWRRSADTWCPIVSGLNFSTTATVRRTLSYDRTLGIAKLDFLVGTADGSLGEIAFVDNKPTSAECSSNNVVPMYGAGFYNHVRLSYSATPLTRLKLVDVNELTGAGNNYLVYPGLKYLLAWGPQACPASFTISESGACNGGVSGTNHAGLVALRLNDGILANLASGSSGLLDPNDLPYSSDFSILDVDAVISIKKGGDPINAATFQYAVSVASGANNILGTKILTSNGSENPLGRQGYFDKSRWVSFGAGAYTPSFSLDAYSVVLWPYLDSVALAYNFMQPYLARNDQKAYVNSPGFYCDLLGASSGCVRLGESFTMVFVNPPSPFGPFPDSVFYSGSYTANTLFAPLQSFLPNGEALDAQRHYIFYADTRQSMTSDTDSKDAYTSMFRPRLLTDTRTPPQAMALPDSLTSHWPMVSSPASGYATQLKTVTIGQIEFFAAKDDRGDSRAYQIIRFDDTGYVNPADTSGKQFTGGGVMFCSSKLAPMGSAVAISGDKCTTPRPNAVGAEGFNLAAALDISPNTTYLASPSKVGYTISPSGVVYINYISQSGVIATINASDPSQKWSAGNSAWGVIATGRVAGCSQTLTPLPSPPTPDKKKTGFWKTLAEVVVVALVVAGSAELAGPFAGVIADVLINMGEKVLESAASLTGDNTYLTVYGGSQLATTCKIS